MDDAGVSWRCLEVLEGAEGDSFYGSRSSGTTVQPGGYGAKVQKLSGDSRK